MPWVFYVDLLSDNYSITFVTLKNPDYFKIFKITFTSFFLHTEHASIFSRGNLKTEKFCFD